MTDNDAAATFVLLGEVANEVNVHGVRSVTDIEMHVDVDVELARKRKDALDLTGMVRIIAGGAADNLSAAFEPLHQQFFGPSVVGQAFLREHADLDLDRPFVVVDQRHYGIEPTHPDPGIKLDLRSHACRPMHNALLKGLLRHGNGRPVPVPTPPRSRTRSTACSTSPSPRVALRPRPLPRMATWSGPSRSRAVPIIALLNSRPLHHRRPEAASDDSWRHSSSISEPPRYRLSISLQSTMLPLRSI